jgi:hypothetical protein
MAATFVPLKSSVFIVNDPWGVTQAERARQNDLACAFRTLDLGGSRLTGIDGTGLQRIHDFRDIVLPGDELQGFTVQARVQVHTDAAGTSVQPRLVQASTSNDFAVGTATTTQAFGEEVIPMVLPFAQVTLRLMVTKSNADALVYCIGYIEILAP